MLCAFQRQRLVANSVTCTVTCQSTCASNPPQSTTDRQGCAFNQQAFILHGWHFATHMLGVWTAPLITYSQTLKTLQCFWTVGAKPTSLPVAVTGLTRPCCCAGWLLAHVNPCSRHPAREWSTLGTGRSHGPQRSQTNAGTMFSVLALTRHLNPPQRCSTNPVMSTAHGNTGGRLD